MTYPVTEAERLQLGVGSIQKKLHLLSKRRGRPLTYVMVLVSRTFFFQVSHSEWAAAVKGYFELLEEGQIEYVGRSASASL